MKRLVAMVLLCGCPQKKEPVVVPDAAVEVKANVVPAPQPPAPAEVEFTGNVNVGKLKPKRIIFVVARGPCLPASTELDVIEQTDVSPGKMFTEMFFPQGTVAHLCAVALDAKGRQIAHAAYAKNPVKLEGQGEVMVNDVELTLVAVKPRPAPKGL